MQAMTEYAQRHERSPRLSDLASVMTGPDAQIRLAHVQPHVRFCLQRALIPIPC